MSAEVAESMTDNEALKGILDAVLKVEKGVRDGYDDVDGQNSISISDTSPHVRPSTPDAVKCVVTNLGASRAYIKEDGKLVGIIAQYESWVSPLSGNKEIRVYCEAGQSTTIAEATYTRSDVLEEDV